MAGPITTIDEFLGAMYRAEVIERGPERNRPDIAAMTALLSTTELRARRAALANIPAERCVISKHHREFLDRVLAAR